VYKLAAQVELFPMFERNQWSTEVLLMEWKVKVVETSATRQKLDYFQRNVALVQYEINFDREANEVMFKHNAYWVDTLGEICAITTVLGLAAVAVGVFHKLTGSEGHLKAVLFSMAAGDGELYEVNSYEDAVIAYTFVDPEEEEWLSSLKAYAEVCMIKLTPEQIKEAEDGLWETREPEVFLLSEFPDKSWAELGDLVYQRFRAKMIPKESAIRWACEVRGFAIPSEGEPEAAAEAEVVNGEDIMKDEELLVLGNVQQMPNKVAERLAEGVEGEPSEQGTQSATIGANDVPVSFFDFSHFGCGGRPQELMLLSEDDQDPTTRTLTVILTTMFP